jgi:hypothetical protein
MSCCFEDNICYSCGLRRWLDIYRDVTVLKRKARHFGPPIFTWSVCTVTLTLPLTLYWLRSIFFAMDILVRIAARPAISFPTNFYKYCSPKCEVRNMTNWKIPEQRWDSNLGSSGSSEAAILYLQICNSTRLKNSITSNQSYLSLKTNDLCCTRSIFDYKCLELFEILRSRPTLGVIYSWLYTWQDIHAQCVREKSCSVSRFQRFVEPAERTSGNEIEAAGQSRCECTCRYSYIGSLMVTPTQTLPYPIALL